VPTLDQMVEEVTGQLRAYGGDQESKTYLAAGIDASATTFTVAHPDRVASGLVEIDEELVDVSVVEATNAQVAIFPWAAGKGEAGDQ